MTISFLTRPTSLVRFLVSLTVRVTECHNINQEAINLRRNWLITDTTGDSPNLGDDDPAVNSTRKSEAVSHCWHWRCPSCYRTGAVCILQKGKLVFGLMIRHTVWDGQCPKKVLLWWIWGYILITPCAVCYCDVTASRHGNGIVRCICSGH